MSGHFTPFLVFIYFSFRLITVATGNFSAHCSLFSSVFLFLHSSLAAFFAVFFLSPCIPSCLFFLFPSLLPSSLISFLPYFVLVLDSLGSTPLSLASLCSDVLDFTRLHSAQSGSARSSWLFFAWLRCASAVLSDTNLRTLIIIEYQTAFTE